MRIIRIFKLIMKTRIQWFLDFVNSQGHLNFSSQNRSSQNREQLTCTCIVYVILIYVLKIESSQNASSQNRGPTVIIKYFFFIQLIDK